MVHVMSAGLEGPAPLSALDYYRLVRERIEHEDNLIVQRLSWLVASQSFLFTAYAIVTSGLTSQPSSNTTHFIKQMYRLFDLIPVVGTLTSILIYASILAAVAAMRRLRNAYRSRLAKDDDLPIQTLPSIRLFGYSAPLLLPLVFIIVWLALWMRGLA